VKNYLIGGLICLLAVFIIGIEPIQRMINESTKQGTLRGVETCMVYSSSELLSEDSVKATCVGAFQKKLYTDGLATGRAGPRNDQKTVSWGGTLQNKTSDHVTTWIQVSVSIFDADGAEQEFQAETSIWIDPLNEADFRVELPELEREQLESIEFCDHEDTEPKACMTWGITEIMGLTI
jgi:hypothetical protein